MSDGIFRPGAKVRLINDGHIRWLEAQYPNAPQSRSTLRVNVGSVGEIIATRPLIDRAVLVKFKGCRFQLSLDRNHLELI